MPHYKDHKLAGEDHKDVFLAENAEQGDALVWTDIYIPDLVEGIHVLGIDPNLTELDLDEEMMPIEFYGIWIPGPASGGGGTGTGDATRAFSFLMH
jgi:hypothetical protein